MATVRVILASLVVGMVGGVGRAAAQVVPPPTAAPPKSPEFVPPPPAPEPPPRPSTIAPPPKAKPADVPKFEYKRLAERDAAGKVIPLTRPAHRVALERNPFIDEEAKKKVSAALVERDAQLERLVVSNLDVVLKVDDDGIAKVDAKDTKEEIRTLGALCSPLRLPGGDLSKSLRTASVLTEKQGQANQMIVQDYTTELSAQFRAAKEAEKASKPPEAAKSEGRPAGMSPTRFLYVMQVEEAVYAYHAMLLEGAKNADKAVAGLNLPDDKRTASAEVVAAVKAATDDAGRLAAMRKFMIAVGPGPGTEVLNKVVALRGK